MMAEKCLLSKIDDSALISLVSQIESDRRNWKYYLNTRGLILYILAMMTEEQTSGRQKNVEISKALQNIGENFKGEFSFLMHYREIKEIYDKMAEDRHRSDYEYFQVKCLKQIALELQYSLDTLNKNDLDYYITKRYVDDTMRRYFVVGAKWNPLMSIDSIPAIIREYYTHNQILNRKYLEGQLEVCNFEISEFVSMKQDSIHPKPSFNKDILIDGFYYQKYIEIKHLRYCGLEPSILTIPDL